MRTCCQLLRGHCDCIALETRFGQSFNIYLTTFSRLIRDATCHSASTHLPSLLAAAAGGDSSSSFREVTHLQGEKLGPTHQDFQNLEIFFFFFLGLKLYTLMVLSYHHFRISALPRQKCDASKRDLTITKKKIQQLALNNQCTQHETRMRGR